MIIANGFIQVKRKTVPEPAIDPATGFASKPKATEWGDPVECQYSATRYNAVGEVEGEPRTEQSYEILIEEQPFAAGQIRLFNLAMDLIGEFPVVSATPLQAVSQVKILV